MTRYVDATNSAREVFSISPDVQRRQLLILTGEGRNYSERKGQLGRFLEDSQESAVYTWKRASEGRKQHVQSMKHLCVCEYMGVATAWGHGSWTDEWEAKGEGAMYVWFFNPCHHPSGKQLSFVGGLSVPKVPSSITS